MGKATKAVVVSETVVNTIMDATAKAMDLILPEIVSLMAQAGILNADGNKVTVEDAARMLNLTVAPPPDGARRRLGEDKDRNALATWSTTDEKGRWHVYIHPDSIQRADKGDRAEVLRIAGGVLHEVTSLLNPPMTVNSTTKDGKPKRSTQRYTQAWKNLGALLGLDTTGKLKTKLSDSNVTARLVEACERACHVAAPAIGGREQNDRIRFSLSLMTLKADGSDGQMLTVPQKNGDGKVVNLSIGEDAATALSTLSDLRYRLVVSLAAPWESDEKGKPVWHLFDSGTLEAFKSQQEQMDKDQEQTADVSTPAAFKVLEVAEQK